MPLFSVKYKCTEKLPPDEHNAQGLNLICCRMPLEVQTFYWMRLRRQHLVLIYKPSKSN